MLRRGRGGRPRFLIDLADVAAFELRREVAPKPKPVARRPRIEGIIQRY